LFMKPHSLPSPDTESPEQAALRGAPVNGIIQIDHAGDIENAMRLFERMMHVSRLATVAEMASGVAHEINQPLAAIASYAHACDRLLSIPNPEIEEIQLALRRIADQAVRAGDIIRRLRSLARDEDTQRGPVDINAVVAELTDVIRSEAKSRAVVYRVELATHLPQLAVHRGQIQQVVLNVVHNALEALALEEMDAREVVVRTGADADGDVEIQICDNGPGVKSEIASRMFDPFYSTKRNGPGLGLAISRTIVHSHNGALDYRPNAPAGACFVIRIPPLRAEES
jgi:two-component system sensor kinase FixL